MSSSGGESGDNSAIRLSEYRQPGSNDVDFAFSVTPPEEEVGETTITIAGSDDPREQPSVNPARAGETTVTVTGGEPPEVHSASEGALLLSDHSYEDTDPQNLVFQFGRYSQAEGTVPTSITVEGGEGPRAHGSAAVGEGGAVAISSDHGEYPLAPVEHPIIESVGTTTSEGVAPTVDVLSYGAEDGGEAEIHGGDGEYPLAPLENPIIKSAGQTELVTGYREERGEFEHLPITNVLTYGADGGGTTALLDRHPLSELSSEEIAEHTLTEDEEEALSDLRRRPSEHDRLLTPSRKWWRDGPIESPALGGLGDVIAKTGAEWDDEDEEWIEFEHTPRTNVWTVEPDESPEFGGTIFMRSDRVWRPDELEDLDAEEIAELTETPLDYYARTDPVTNATTTIEHRTGDERIIDEDGEPTDRWDRYEHKPATNVLSYDAEDGTPTHVRDRRVWRDDEIEALRDQDLDAEEIEAETAKDWFYYPESDPAPASVGRINHRTGDERIIDEDGEVTDRWDRYEYKPTASVLTREPADPALFAGTEFMADRRVWRPDEIEVLRDRNYDDEEIVEITARESVYAPLTDPAPYASVGIWTRGQIGLGERERVLSTTITLTPDRGEDEGVEISGRGIHDPSVTLTTTGDPGIATPPIPVTANISLETAHDRWPLSTNASPALDATVTTTTIGGYALVSYGASDGTVTLTLSPTIADARSEPLFRTRVRLTPEPAWRPDEGVVPTEVTSTPTTAFATTETTVATTTETRATSPLSNPTTVREASVSLSPDAALQKGWQPAGEVGTITKTVALRPLSNPATGMVGSVSLHGPAEGVTANTEPVEAVGITLAGTSPLRGGIERAEPVRITLSPVPWRGDMTYGTALNADNEFVLQLVDEVGNLRLDTAPLDDEIANGP